MRRAAAVLLALLLAACQLDDMVGTQPVVDGDMAAAVPAETVQPFAGLERSPGEIAKDDALQAQISRRLAELDRRAYRAVTVEVWGGRALLMGAVIKPMQRRKAEQVAAAVPGIAAVHNDLVLAEDRALDIFAADPGREDQVRRALGVTGRTGATVRVINGVTFLLGAAPTAAAAAEMKADATDVAGVKWVVAHLNTP